MLSIIFKKISYLIRQIIIISMLRQYFNLSSAVSRSLRFSLSTGSFFPKANPPPESKDQTTNRKFLKLGDKHTQSTAKTNESFNFPKESVEDLVKKINEANKYFLGIKYNTNYLKANKVLKYEEAMQMKAAKATVNDIPLELSKAEGDSQNSLFQSCDQNAALTQKSGQIVFGRSRVEPTLRKIQQLYANYIVKLSKKERLIGLQPNFQLQCIKTFNGLGPRIVFNLKNEEAAPQIKIKSITLLKGLSVLRNENYSTDSFEKNESELADGIIQYKLYRQAKQQYPEIEWLSTKKINVRFEILVKGGPAVEILDSGASIGSSQHVVHNLVVETDLVPPPHICEHQMTTQQYLRSYRLDYNSMTITNVDRKNEFYSLTFTQKQKTTTIINRIE